MYWNLPCLNAASSSFHREHKAGHGISRASIAAFMVQTPQACCSLVLSDSDGFTLSDHVYVRSDLGFKKPTCSSTCCFHGSTAYSLPGI